MFPRALRNNMRYYTWYFTLTGFTSTLPIWVAFYLSKITIEQLAIVIAISSATAIILEVPTGALADLVGRRITVFLGMLARASMFALLPFVNTYFGFILFALLEGLGEALVSGADVSLMYDTLKEEGKEETFSKLYNKLLFYYRGALIAGSFLAGPLFAVWRGLPHVTRGVVYLISAFCVLLLVEPHIDSEKFTLKRYLAQTKEGIKELTKSVYMIKFSLFYILIGAITWACLTYFNQPFAYDYGWSPSQMSVITGFAYLISSGVLYLLIAKPTWLSRNRVYLGFPLIMCLGFLPALLVDRNLALVLMIIIQFTGSGRFSILDKYVHQEFSSKNRATATSTLNMVLNIVMAALIYLGGKVQGAYDTRHAFFLLGIVTIVFVVPLSISLVLEHNRYNTVKINT